MALALTVRRMDANTLIPELPAVYNPEAPVTRLIGGGIPGLFSLPVSLVDREVCESDPSTLQLIPYVLLADQASGDFFVYVRGDMGGETRLHGKCSLGLGGHIDVAPVGDETLQEVIVKETVRELQEEVGYTFTAEELAGLNSTTEGIEQNCFIVYSDADEVGRVHLGYCFILAVARHRMGPTEANVINKGEWLSLEELVGRVSNNEIELEQWSDMVLRMLVHSYQEQVHASMEAASRADLSAVAAEIMAGMSADELQDLGIAQTLDAVEASVEADEGVIAQISEQIEDAKTESADPA